MFAACVGEGISPPNIAKTARKLFMRTPSPYGLTAALHAKIAASGSLPGKYAILAGVYNRPTIEGIG
jgi:hypothetical protein